MLLTKEWNTEEEALRHLTDLHIDGKEAYTVGTLVIYFL